MSQPVHSMTAFARAEQRSALGLLAIEIRSVNSRHLEASFRLADAVRDAFDPRTRLRSAGPTSAPNDSNASHGKANTEEVAA